MEKFISLHDHILAEQAKGARKDGYWIPVDTMNKLIAGIMASFDEEIKVLKDDLLSRKKTFPKRGVFDVLKNWWFNAIYGSRNKKNPYYFRNTLGHLGTFSKNEMTLHQYKLFKEYADELESKLLTEQRYYIEDLIDQWANRFRYELENTLRDTIRLMYRPTEPVAGPAPKGAKVEKPSPVLPAPPKPTPPPAEETEEFPDVPPAEVEPEAETDEVPPDELPPEEDTEYEPTEDETPDEETDEVVPPPPAGEFPESEPVPETKPTTAVKNKEQILNDINSAVYSFDILDNTQTRVDKDKMKKRLKNFHVYNLSKPDDDYVMDMVEREFVIKQLFRYYEIAQQKDLPSKKLEERTPEELDKILEMLKDYSSNRTPSRLNGLITKLLKIMPWPAMSDSYFKKMMSLGVRKKPQPSPEFKKLFENATLYERTLICLEALRSIQ